KLDSAVEGKAKSKAQTFRSTGRKINCGIRVESSRRPSVIASGIIVRVSAIAIAQAIHPCERKGVVRRWEKARRREFLRFELLPNQEIAAQKERECYKCRRDNFTSDSSKDKQC